jgi:hypothetical protein
MAKVMGDKVIFEEVPCWNCKGTKMTERGILCPEWNNKVRGRLGGHCPHCGATNRNQHQVVGRETVECYYCSGTGQQMETSNSYVTENIYSSLTYKVYRDEKIIKEIFSGEGTGMGIGGCTDYGASVLKTDEEVIKDVDKIHRWSYLQIMDEDNMLCREIAIIVGKYGYTVRSVF